MNPKAKDMALGGLPPLAEVRKNRRVRWYRCPIEPARLLGRRDFHLKYRDS